MTAALIVCPSCDGAGEHTVCANDGSGCSHTLDRTWECRTCGGTGQCTYAEAGTFLLAHCEHGVHEDDPAGCRRCEP